MPEQRRPLVVGWGNPLRGDDGVGPRVASEVGRRLGGAVDVRTPVQLLPELAVDLAAASRVVLVDAAVDQPAGTVRARRIAPATDPGHGLHDLRPETLLGYAALLSGTAPPTWLVTVGAAATDIGDGLSPVVVDALPAALATVHDLVAGGH